MFKKLLISLLISVSILNTGALAFDDIPSNSPYFYGIEYLRRNGVFPNVKLFKPKLIINKAEFIKYLVKLNNPDFKKGKAVKLPYKDTKDNAWYAEYFHEAIQLGIISEEVKKIEPYKKLSIIEACELLFHSQSIPIPKKYKGGIPYKDVKKNKRSAALIMRALEFDIIQPQKADYVGIYRKINRAEAANMIYKMDLINLTAPKKVNESSYGPKLQKFINAWEIVNSTYVDKDKINQEELSDAAINGMVEALDDPYSAYLDKEKNSAFSDDLDGEIEGIGAHIAINKEEEIVIITPIKNSPAEKAGILAGDIILKAGEHDLKGLTLFEAVNYIKGPKGTPIELTIKRSSGTKKITVIRDVIIIHATEYEMIENETVVHMKLSQFSQNAHEEFKEIVEIIENNSEIKGLIIDLRDNPGGLLSSSISILGHLLETESAAINIQYNYFKYTQTTRGKGELNGFPIVVLINKGSASASEIVAGALKDYKLATIVGETSFGKGTVQEVNSLEGNSSLKITVAKWLTPLNHSIQGNGITPNIEVIQPAGSARDKQLERAIIEVKKLIRAKK